jgi:nucleoside-diphosphate-sugar epimerase
MRVGRHVTGTVLVTGGAGYIGAGLCAHLVEQGRSVRVLDVLLHGQNEIADDLEAIGVEVMREDLRDVVARRRALDGVESVVHLAAIVGDPACALDPAESQEVNVEGSRSMLADAEAAGVSRFVFASTCSNYGRMSDPSVPIDETGELRPVSLYAEQKVAVEQQLLSDSGGALVPVCLRLATVYGVAARMRFDLTVNEFTRELWAGRRLEVFGEQFWRPYIHVRDVGRAIGSVLAAPDAVVGRDVFNVGRSDQNFRKADLVEIAQERLPDGEVAFVQRADDPRDYKVNFDKIGRVLGFDLTMTVPQGIDEVATALESGTFPDPFSPRYRNTP